MHQTKHVNKSKKADVKQPAVSQTLFSSKIAPVKKNPKNNSIVSDNRLVLETNLAKPFNFSVKDPGRITDESQDESGDLSDSDRGKATTSERSSDYDDSAATTSVRESLSIDRGGEVTMASELRGLYYGNAMASELRSLYHGNAMTSRQNPDHNMTPRQNNVQTKANNPGEAQDAKGGESLALPTLTSCRSHDLAEVQKSGRNPDQDRLDGTLRVPDGYQQTKHKEEHYEVDSVSLKSPAMSMLSRTDSDKFNLPEYSESANLRSVSDLAKSTKTRKTAKIVSTLCVEANQISNQSVSLFKKSKLQHVENAKQSLGSGNGDLSNFNSDSGQNSNHLFEKQLGEIVQSGKTHNNKGNIFCLNYANLSL